MSAFALPLDESELVETKMLLTIKLKPWSKFYSMPWSELHGLVVNVEHCGDFKVTGIEDVLLPESTRYTRTIIVQQL